MLDMDRRIRPIRRRTFALLAVGLVVSAPWTGWWTLAPLVVAGAIFVVAERLIADSTKYPEIALFASWLACQVIISSAVALTGELRFITVFLLVIPIQTLSARFSISAIAAGVAFTIALAAAVVVGPNPSVVLHEPPLLITPMLVFVTCAMLSTPLMRSEIEHRSEALIDPLTGMLNRNALARRTEVLEQQSEVSGEPVGVIVCDVDHFKGVNDSHGHPAGDAVLKDLAYVLRKMVRAFEAAFRIGGEEFLILLPGADLAFTCQQAERLRRAIETTPVGDRRHVTMSFGVAASERGIGFDYAAVSGEADEALYEAKRAGRNRVCATASTSPPAIKSEPRLPGRHAAVAAASQ
jgi:diguanylate cyclase (GGDEF)-like protein